MRRDYKKVAKFEFYVYCEDCGAPVLRLKYTPKRFCAACRNRHKRDLYLRLKAEKKRVVKSERTKKDN